MRSPYASSRDIYKDALLRLPQETRALIRTGYVVGRKEGSYYQKDYLSHSNYEWYSRYVLSWELSTSLKADFCIRALTISKA
jgi:hypothetical protein